MSKKAIIALDEGSSIAGFVENIIEMTAEGAVGFLLPRGKLLWDCGQYPVILGDRWEDGGFSRGGAPIAPLPTVEETLNVHQMQLNDRIEAEVDLDYRLSMMELGLA